TQAATLLIPNRAAPTPAAAQPGRVQDLAGWRARVSALTTEAQDAGNVIGFAVGARSDFDALDWRKPPVPPGPWVRAAIAHPEWGARAGDYRRDLRSPSSEGELWEIEVQSEHRGDVVTLELSEIAPGAAAAAVIDREQGTSIAWPGGTTGLRGSLPQQIVWRGPRPGRLAVVAGSQDYVADASRSITTLVPVRAVLDQNAPNPFPNATRIRFGLPRAARVSLGLYGLQGERVATLVEGALLEPGYH